MTPPVPTPAELRRMAARFAPVQLRADLAALRAGERRTYAALVDAARVMDALFLRGRVVQLAREILTIEAEGSYAKARALLGRLARVRPAVKRALDRLARVPVDIAPRFTTASALR